NGHRAADLDVPAQTNSLVNVVLTPMIDKAWVRSVGIGRLPAMARSLAAPPTVTLTTLNRDKVFLRSEIAQSISSSTNYQSDCSKTGPHHFRLFDHQYQQCHDPDHYHHHAFRHDSGRPARGAPGCEAGRRLDDRL